MSKIMGFLEQLGGNAALRHASRTALLRAMQHTDVTTAEMSAILHAHDAAIGDIVGSRDTMYCDNRAVKAPKKSPAKKSPAKKSPAKKAPSSKQPAKKAPAQRK